METPPLKAKSEVQSSSAKTVDSQTAVSNDDGRYATNCALDDYDHHLLSDSYAEVVLPLRRLSLLLLAFHSATALKPSLGKHVAIGNRVPDRKRYLNGMSESDVMLHSTGLSESIPYSGEYGRMATIAGRKAGRLECVTTWQSACLQKLHRVVSLSMADPASGMHENEGQEKEKEEDKETEEPWAFLQDILRGSLSESDAPEYSDGMFPGRSLASRYAMTYEADRTPFWSEYVKMCLPDHRIDRYGKFKGTYVDCNFGRGVTSKILLGRLSAESKLYAFVTDVSSVAIGRQLEMDDSRFRMIDKPFSEIETVLAGEKLDGVVLNLEQQKIFDDDRTWTDRLFPSMNSGMLDLRTNPHAGISAAQWLRTATREEIAWVLANYGDRMDDILADRIAQAIDDERQLYGPIEFSRHLALVVRTATNEARQGRTGTGAQVFQALRAFLNHELQELERALTSIFHMLDFRGRCTIVTTRMGQSQVVQRVLREHEEPPFSSAYLDGENPERLRELFPLLCTEKPFAIQEMGELITVDFFELWRRRAKGDSIHVIQKNQRNSECLKDDNWRIRPAEERFIKPTQTPFVGGQDD